MVAVVRGKQTESCDSLDTFAQIRTAGKVVPSYTRVNEYMEDGLERMKECQAAISALVEGAVAGEGKSACCCWTRNRPFAIFAMGQVIHKICKSQSTLCKLLGNDRHDIIVWEPVFRAEVLFNSSGSSMEMGMMYSGDDIFFEHLRDTLERIQSSKGLFSDMRNVHSGLFLSQSHSEPSQFVLPHEYDQSSPLEQYMSQSPLGQQIVVQIEMQRRNNAILVGDRVKVWFGLRRNNPILKARLRN